MRLKDRYRPAWAIGSPGAFWSTITMLQPGMCFANPNSHLSARVITIMEASAESLPKQSEG
jgi:hypothetical protein